MLIRILLTAFIITCTPIQVFSADDSEEVCFIWSYSVGEQAKIEGFRLLRDTNGAGVVDNIAPSARRVCIVRPVDGPHLYYLVAFNAEEISGNSDGVPLMPGDTDALFNFRILSIKPLNEAI